LIRTIFSSRSHLRWSKNKEGEKEMKKRFGLLLLAAVMVFSLMACSSGDSTSTDVAKTDESTTDASADATKSDEGATVKLGFIPMDLAVEYFSSLLEGAQAFEAAHPDVELVVWDGAADVSKQVEGVENLINAGCQAIDLRCLDEAALEDSVKNATEAGIYITTYPDSMPERSTGVAYDDYNRGYLLAKEAAKWINEKLSGEAEVAFLFEPDNQNAMKRIDAFHDVFDEDCPNATIVAEQEGFNTDVAMATAESILQAHPNVKVIICSNDAAGLGVYEAVTAAGKATDDFFVGGIDGDASAMDLIAEGGIYRCSVAPAHLTQDIEWAVMQNMYNAVTTGEYEDQIVVEEYAVTYDNVTDYRAMEPSYGE
jgi:ribose transport system substrate-binding protein